MIIKWCNISEKHRHFDHLYNYLLPFGYATLSVEIPDCNEYPIEVDLEFYGGPRLGYSPIEIFFIISATIMGASCLICLITFNTGTLCFKPLRLRFEAVVRAEEYIAKKH